MIPTIYPPMYLASDFIYSCRMVPVYVVSDLLLQNCYSCQDYSMLCKLVFQTEIYNEFIDTNAVSPVNIDCKVSENCWKIRQRSNLWCSYKSQSDSLPMSHGITSGDGSDGGKSEEQSQSVVIWRGGRSHFLSNEEWQLSAIFALWDVSGSCQFSVFEKYNNFKNCLGEHLQEKGTVKRQNLLNTLQNWCSHL